MDELKGSKTNKWSTCFIRGNDIFILGKERFEKDSIHKYSDEGYCGLLKHELSHMFFKQVSGKRLRVVWLDEGIAEFISGRNSIEHSLPKKFDKFLSSFNKHSEGVFEECGFVVEFLVKKYGKEKLLELVARLKSDKINKEDKFNELFLEVYGFALTYSNLNKV
jgi:hypothetical protein